MLNCTKVDGMGVLICFTARMKTELDTYTGITDEQIAVYLLESKSVCDLIGAL